VSARERLSELVVRFGEISDQSLSLDDAGACAFRFGENGDLGHFQLLEDSATVILWATVGFLPPDSLAPLRVVRLLQFQDLGQDADGFTLGSEPGTGRVVIAARRAVEEIEDSSVLAGWTDRLTKAVRSVRTSLVDDFPMQPEDFRPLEVDLDDDGEDLEDEGEETEVEHAS